MNDDMWNRLNDPDGTPKYDSFELSGYADHLIDSAAEQMYGMIWSLASSMAGETQGLGDDPREVALGHIKAACADYENGVKLGRSGPTSSRVLAVKEIMLIGFGRPEATNIVERLVQAGIIDPSKKIDR
jgi:hypothetical protein